MSFLPQNLLFLRKRKGLSQAEIQAHTGFKRNTWSNWETGISEPSIENLLIIANLFDTDIGKLITEDLQNVGDSEKSEKKTDRKNVGDTIGNNVGDSGKNYEKNDFVSYLKDEGKIIIGDAKAPQPGDVDPEAFNTLLDTFKAILSGLYSNSTSMKVEIIDLRKKIEELTRDQGKK